MKVKRIKVEIIQNMLEIIRSRDGNIKPTQVMYKANLSYQMLSVYMSDITIKGFIVENTDKKGRRTYSITERGNSFLIDYNVMRNFLDSYNLGEEMELSPLKNIK